MSGMSSVRATPLKAARTLEPQNETGSDDSVVGQDSLHVDISYWSLAGTD